VEDEEGEGVWGYLVPIDDHTGEVLVLRRRSICPVPAAKVGKASGTAKVSSKEYINQEESYEKDKASVGVTASGYLIGRHIECGKCNNP
jgi:serine/threonine-protein kinase Chk2